MNIVVGKVFHLYIMPTIIRRIEATDNQAIARLIKNVFVEYGIDRPGTVFSDPTTDALFELFQSDKSAYWVAEENGQLLGGCGIYPTEGLPEGCGELVKFYLAPESRGQGIGKLLYGIVQNTAQSLGYTQLYLESFPELGDAVGIYEGLGFEFLDHALGNSGHHACTIWMLKQL